MAFSTWCLTYLHFVKQKFLINQNMIDLTGWWKCVWISKFCYICRCDVTFICTTMVFSLYPFDKHYCSLQLYSCKFLNKIFLIYTFYISDSQDDTQLRLYGQFSYDKILQRELQYTAVIRELSVEERFHEGNSCCDKSYISAYKKKFSYYPLLKQFQFKWF